VRLTLEYYQAGADRGLRLAWRTPGALAAMAANAPARDTRMATYLPAGTPWYDFWTGERHEGGRTATRAAPLDIVPLYVRAGAIVPLGPVLQYATEQPDTPYEIRIYPGADGTFTLYEDDNETYDYEKGRSARVTLAWNDAARTLTIGKRQGSYPGMTRRRTLNVVLVDAGNGNGLATATPTRAVAYAGQAMTVRFGTP